MPTIVNIFGPIGIPPNTLEGVKDAVGRSRDEVHVFINSEGGDATEGLAIYDFLKGIPNKVKSFIEGAAFSAGSIIPLAADMSDRYMLPNAQIMIHNPFVEGFSGDAGELEAGAAWLRQTEGKLQRIYSDRTQLNFDEAGALMNQDTFIDAEIAVEFGFVGDVLELVPLNTTKFMSEKKEVGFLAKIKALFSEVEKVKNELEAAEGEEAAEVVEEVVEEPEVIEENKVLEGLQQEVADLKEAMTTISDSLQVLNGMVAKFGMKPVAEGGGADAVVKGGGAGKNEETPVIKTLKSNLAKSGRLRAKGGNQNG